MTRVHSLYPSKVSNHKGRSTQRCDWFWTISRKNADARGFIRPNECFGWMAFTGLAHINYFSLVIPWSHWPLAVHDREREKKSANNNNLYTYCHLFMCFYFSCARAHSITSLVSGQALNSLNMWQDDRLKLISKCDNILFRHSKCAPIQFDRGGHDAAHQQFNLFSVLVHCTERKIS